MRNSFDYYKQIESPEMYLCNPDQKFLCALIGENRTLTLRFNDLSELSFTVPKIEGKEESYNLVETKRLVYLDKIGWFQISAVTETIEGEKYTKNVTAQSHQAVFANKGFVTEERLYMFYNPNDPTDSQYDSANKAAIPSVVGQLHQQLGVKIAISNSDIEQSSDRKDWTIIYIEPELMFHARNYGSMYESADGYENICRSFDANADSNGYDFMINSVEKAFEVIFEFDFLYHTIKVKTLDNITKPTNIYLSFENVVNTIRVKENAEDIVTVLNCDGNNLDIRTVNPMGTNYIVDFSYYKRLIDDNGIEYPWMSEALINALNEWEVEFEKWCHDDSNRASHTKGYSTLVEELQALYTEKAKADADIQYANLKLTDMQVARDQYINGDDKTLEGSGYVTAENVKTGEKSLLIGSTYASTPFTENSAMVGHTSAPTPTKVANTGNDGYHYTFSFSDGGTSGTPKSLIRNFVESDNPEDNISIPFYFMDSDTHSYCKLTIESEVGVVKDDDEFIAETGSVKVRGVTFRVSGHNGIYTVTPPSGEAITATQVNSYFTYNGTRYRVLSGGDGIITLYCFFVSGFERYTTYTETVGDSGWCSIWESHINNWLAPRSATLQANVDSKEEEMQYICNQCNVQKFIKNKGQALYDELSNYWIEGSYTNSNLATDDTTTISKRIKLANELLEAAKVDLAKNSQPQFQLTVDSLNFIKMIEFKKFSDELALGAVITIEKEDGIFYRPALMSIEYNIDDTNNFTMTFSNSSKPGDTSMTFADLFKESSSAARTVSANWSNLMDYSRNKETITSLIDDPLDRTLRAARDNMSAQAFIIDNTGILGRKYADDSETSFNNKQLRIMNNLIIFTDDNWETAKTALGNIKYTNELGEEVEGYGLIADAIIGDLLIGKRVKVINESGTISLDENGITIKDGNGNATFSATNDGDVSVTGDIVAKSLTLLEGVTIGYNSITGTPNLSVYLKKDENDQVVSMLNASANSIDIRSNRLTITSTNFKLSADGTVEARNANIKGNIEADSGYIGGLNLADFSINTYLASYVSDGSFTSDNAYDGNTFFYLSPQKWVNTSKAFVKSQMVLYCKIGYYGKSLLDVPVGIRYYCSDASIYFEEECVIPAVNATINDRQTVVAQSCSDPSTYNPIYDRLSRKVSAPNWFGYSTQTFTWDSLFGNGDIASKLKNKSIFNRYMVLPATTVPSNNKLLIRPGQAFFFANVTYDASYNITQINSYEVFFIPSNIDLTHRNTESVFYDDRSYLGKAIYYNKRGFDVPEEGIYVGEGGIGLGSGGYYFRPDGVIYCQRVDTGSDLALKTNIEELPFDSLEFIKGLRPVQYAYKQDVKQHTNFGFIAQDVLQVLEKYGYTICNSAIVSRNSSGYAICYNELIAPIVAALQYCIDKIDKIEKKENMDK